MLSSYCTNCKFVMWAVGIGQGIRCNHPDVREDGKLPPIISEIRDCEKKENK